MKRPAAENKKVRRRRALCFSLFAFAFFLFVTTMMNPTNVAQTRPDHPDAALRTRRLALPLATAAAVVREVVPNLKTYGRRWRLVSSGAIDNAFAASSSIDNINFSPDAIDITFASGAFVVRVEVPVVVFTDDLQVVLRQSGAGHTLLDVRSASRVGRGDLGENKRHIRQLLRALQARLGAQMPAP